ncbi:hypothetical protein YQE_06518, partial [Dendroctonus ponderosae]
MRFSHWKRPRSPSGRTGLYSICRIPDLERQPLGGGIEGNLLSQNARITTRCHK